VEYIGFLACIDRSGVVGRHADSSIETVSEAGLDAIAENSQASKMTNIKKLLVVMGAIITALIDPPGQGIMVTDAARTAIDLYQLYREQLMAMIRQCQHGRYLMECGLGEDLPVCIAVNTSNRTPQMVDGIVS